VRNPIRAHLVSVTATQYARVTGDRLRARSLRDRSVGWPPRKASSLQHVGNRLAEEALLERDPSMRDHHWFDGQTLLATLRPRWPWRGRRRLSQRRPAAEGGTGSPWPCPTRPGRTRLRGILAGPPNDVM